jgi:hypothetical protein
MQGSSFHPSENNPGASYICVDKKKKEKKVVQYVIHICWRDTGEGVRGNRLGLRVRVRDGEKKGSTYSKTFESQNVS